MSPQVFCYVEEVGIKCNNYLGMFCSSGISHQVPLAVSSVSVHVVSYLTVVMAFTVKALSQNAVYR
jgi:hypothetical protein